MQRLPFEGFGMPQVKQEPAVNRSSVSKRWVCSIPWFMGKQHFWPASLRKSRHQEAILGEEAGFEEKHKVVFKEPRTVDYRADFRI